jgi:ABC-type multidrug transport system ATPase subunit
MAQRLIFILALLANPNLIIMDEPTSAIDPPIAELYSEKIKHFAAQPNRAILLVTQDLKFAEEVSDKIAFLNGGSLTNFQTPKEFFENPPDIPELKNFINAHKELTE